MKKPGLERIVGMVGIAGIAAAGIAAAGCAVPVDSDVGAQTEALRLAGAPAPSAPEVPTCWYAREGLCDTRCGISSGRAGGRTRTAGTGTRSGRSGDAHSSYATGASARTRHAASSRGDLTTEPDDDCPTPNGVVACPHCSREKSFGDFEVHGTATAHVGPRVVITDGYGSYRVVDIDDLVSFAPPYTSVSGLPVRKVQADLSGGTVIWEVGAPLSFDNDVLYLLFTVHENGKTGPVQQWTKCPPSGACTTLSL